MAKQTLQEKIDAAGSPVKALWKPSAPPWKPAAVTDEFVGWAREQAASYESVSMSDLSFHMRDYVITGPDVTRLLADTSVNNYRKFADGQAKQFVCTTPAGNFISDGILLRENEHKYVLTGPAASHNWVRYHSELGGYDVEFEDFPSAGFGYTGPQRFFRFQVQGPAALDVVEKMFGAPIPETKFFHSTTVELDGRRFRALRHGMVGQAGYEFIGDFADYDFVREAILSAGEEFDIAPVGALAYATNGQLGGWLSTPVPGIYTGDELRPYREWLTAFSFEGNYPLHGSYFSEDIEDYYTSPYELGYGRILDLEHDFPGRDALLAVKDDESLRTKVTLVFDSDEVEQLRGEPDGYFSVDATYRVESDGELVGIAWGASYQAREDNVFALALLDPAHQETGTQLEFVYGEHPGPGTPPDADLGFARFGVSVAPSPYNEYARLAYRKD